MPVSWPASIPRAKCAQASARNADSIVRGRVDLRQASVDALPFADARFDKALAVNSMQVRPDASAGLANIRRVMKPGGRIALGFTPHSGQARQGLLDARGRAGFVDAELRERDALFGALAARPGRATVDK